MRKVRQFVIKDNLKLTGESQVMTNEQVDQQTNATSDGNVVGDDSSSQIVKAEGGSSISGVTQVIGDYHEHHHYAERAGRAAASLYLPPKTYHRLIGRFDQLDSIMDALRDPEHKPMIAIVGLGGIGKTALARETAERCQSENLFDHIVWASAKTEHFVSESTTETGEAPYDIEELLSDIGRQCDRPDIPQMPADQRQAAVSYLLANLRVLVVMDNLDTVPESEKLVNEVFQILGKSKLLITSRHRIKHGQALILNLSGFLEEEGVMFLREESKGRGIEVVAQANRSSLVEIHLVTGGAPLAMKLVVGQISRQPMEVVLNTLKKASFKEQDYEFYRFVYWHSWEVLSEQARMTLVDMSVFPPVIGGKTNDLQAISQLKPSELWLAMDSLVTMSLVDKSGEVGKERFALHPLTHYFVLSDITQEWWEL
jgi:hypothetical protein